jgi:endothelin-converting enzyme
MTLAQLDKLVPEINISTFLKAQSPPGYTISRVNVYNQKYFKALATDLKNVDRKTLHDYFEWGLTRAWVSGLHKDFISPLVRFQTAKGVKDPELSSTERWKTCLMELDTEMGWIGSAFFVQRAFSKEAKAFGERMIGEIKNEFTTTLNTPTWMSDAIKIVSLSKGETYLPELILLSPTIHLQLTLFSPENDAKNWLLHSIPKHLGPAIRLHFL